MILGDSNFKDEINNHDHMEPIAKSARLHNSTSSVEDRLSQLPRDVAHHVLSFLPIHDLAKLSFTSKKYYKLCLSVPSLVFNDSEISFRKGSVERDQLMCFIKRLLTSHQGTKMTTLHIEWPTKGEASRIKSWLNHAIDCQVNEIILILDHRSGLFVIPVNVLRCESLTSVTIQSKRGKNLQTKPFPSGFSSCLKYLHLANLEIVDESLGDWISSTCKFLEKLELIKISGVKNFKISNASLLVINVTNCAFDHLDISAQLLHDIKFVGRSLPFSALLLVHTPNFLNISCYVSLFRHIHVRRSESKYYVDLSLECGYSKNATNHSRLQSSLSSIVQVTDLKTNCCSIKAMHQYKCLPIAFTNLQSLIFQYDPVDYFLFPATTLFLQGLAHSLKKLLIRSYMHNDNLRWRLQRWESKDFMFLDELEEVKIEIMGGKDDGGLIECLLEKAKKLKKMTISYLDYVPIKLAYKLMELVSANGAAFRLQGKSMVLELKPQLVADTLEN